MTGALWFLIYQPLGLGSQATPIEGAGWDVLYAAIAGPQAQSAAMAGTVAQFAAEGGVQAMGAVK